jgi:hypothetical protein
MSHQTIAPNSAVPRIAGLDVARGLALIAMATYHFCWDLELFGFLAPGTVNGGILKLYARSIATSFLFLVGFSLVLATTNGIRWHAYFRRLAMIVGAAAIISVATWFATPNEWIFFGILHSIALFSIVGDSSVVGEWRFGAAPPRPYCHPITLAMVFGALCDAAKFQRFCSSVPLVCRRIGWNCCSQRFALLWLDRKNGQMARGWAGCSQDIFPWPP